MKAIETLLPLCHFFLSNGRDLTALRWNQSHSLCILWGLLTTQAIALSSAFFVKLNYRWFSVFISTEFAEKAGRGQRLAQSDQGAESGTLSFLKVRNPKQISRGSNKKRENQD